MRLQTSLVVIVLVWFLNSTKGQQQQGFRVCKDSYRDCLMWFRAGMCHTSAFKEFINNGCPKTCGLCTDRTSIPPREGLQGAGWSYGNQRSQRQPFGTNIYLKKVNPRLWHYPLSSDGGSILQDKEKFLKQQFHDPLSGFSKYLNEGHKIADNSTANTSNATNTSTAQKNNCTDLFIKCGKWKEEELCKDYKLREYLRYGCAKTCRYCNCRDTYREAPYCAEWKNKGFCDTYPGQMDTYCPKTCLLCGDSVSSPPTPATPTAAPTAPTPTIGQQTLPAPTGISPFNRKYRLNIDQPFEETRIFKAKKPLTFLANKKQQREPLIKAMQSLRKKSLMGGNEIPLPSGVRFDSELDRPATKPNLALQTLERSGNKLVNHAGGDQDLFENLDKNLAAEFSFATKDQNSEIEGYPQFPDEFDEQLQDSEEVKTAAIRQHDGKDQKGPSDYRTYLDAEGKLPGIKSPGSDYYVSHYSKDPDVAASQQLEQQQLMAETGEKVAYGRSNFNRPLNKLQTKHADKNSSHLYHSKKSNGKKVSHKKY